MLRLYWNSLVQKQTVHVKLFNINNMMLLQCDVRAYVTTEIISKWVDERSPVDVIYLDFQKAFDKVTHQILIIQLRAHAMGDSIVN